MTKGFLRFLRGNTLALLALFIALGGTTYAATALPKNSVGAKQLKKNAVTNPKIANGAVTGAKIANNSVKGADVLESSLGNVPSATNAAQLGGTAASGYLKTGAAAGGALSGTYPNPGLADASVTTSKIAGGAVGVSKFGTIPAARANTLTATTQSIGNGSLTTVNFDNESFDTAGLHDLVTTNSVLTAPVAGIYQLTGNVRWASNATGSRFVGLETPAGRIASVWVPAAPGGADTDLSISDVFALAAGDTVHMEVYQDSGGALTLIKNGTDAPNLSLTWIGPSTVGTITGLSVAARAHASRSAP
jgi:hypothetical protein